MKISAIRRVGVAPGYDMTVKEHHNFMVSGNIILHNCDAVRYYCVSRVLPAQQQRDQARAWEDEDEEQESYDEFMCGGEITAGYLIG